MLKVGIVGVGSMGPAFMVFNSIPETRVTAICDIDKEQLNLVGKKYNISDRFVNYEDMLKSDIDIVAIMTPIQIHGQQAIQALNAGKHVLCEYIAANTVEECYELAETAERSGRKYMMVETDCYLKQYVLLKELVAADKFGELYFGEGEYIHECQRLFYNPDGSLTWRGQLWRESNGGFGVGIHTLGPLLQIFEERVVSVSALGSSVHTLPKLKIEDSIIALCKTESGKLIKLRMDIVSNRPHNQIYYSLQGTKGVYEAPRSLGDDHKIWFMDDCKKYEWRPLKDYEACYLPEIWKHPPEEALKAGHWGQCYLIARDFMEAVLHDKKPPLDIYDALHITAVGLAAEESIAKGGIPMKVLDFKNR